MHLTDASAWIRRTAFRRLLAGGALVVPAEVLEELGVSDKDGKSALRDLEAGGRIRLDENGDIVGSAGLSVVPSRHRLRIEKRWFWTWCAWDAAGILGALRASSAVRSRDPLGGEPIEVIFSGGVPEPNEAVVFRAVDDGYLSKHDEYCPLTNLSTTGGWPRPRSRLAELALEAQIAPARVLLGQLADQLPALFADRGSTAARTTSEGRPLPSDQLSGSS